MTIPVVAYSNGAVPAVAVKIKLKRVGKIHAPQYRVIVADSRTKRDGRAIEEIGIYQPMADPSIIQIDSERAQHWLKVGAQPTEAVLVLLKITGDWQKFKGLPGQEGTLRVAPPKESRLTIFEAAAKEAADEPKTPKPKKAVVADAVVADAVVADAVVAAAVADAAVAESVAVVAAEAAVVAEAEAVVEIAEANAGEVTVAEAEAAIEVAAEADIVADAAAAVADEAVAEAIDSAES